MSDGGLVGQCYGPGIAIAIVVGGRLQHRSRHSLVFQETASNGLENEPLTVRPTDESFAAFALGVGPK